jgi:membrane-bound lytic murein transglycosylase D
LSTARRWVAVACASATLTACAHGSGGAHKSVKPVVQSGPADPIARLIAGADAHLNAGLAECKQGHLNQARVEFDHAVDLYLNAPGGATADPRLAQAYRRTLDAIQLRELEALAAGDGFRETPSEPAAIDDLADLPVASGAPSEDARRLAEQAMAGETNDLTIVLNDAVLSCIDLYQGPLRDWFANALSRGGRYLPRIREVFAAEGIPQDLAYVPIVESAFKPSALSRAQAKGMWQFIPETGRRYGLAQDWWVDERSNPEKATRAAARFLRSLYETFQDWNLALAAYNTGPGRVLRGIERTGADDFWTLARGGYLAQETQNYVPMIHAAIVVAKAPDKYGIDVEMEPALAYEPVPVAGAVDLRVIAECAGTDLDEVQLLNPELRRLATPANRTFEVKVPKGRGPALRKCLDQLPPEKRATFRTHTIARGQTLSTVARLYGAKVADIASANGIRGDKRMARGTELIIPIRRSATLPTPPPPRPPGAPATDVADIGSTRLRVHYRVKPGDTLHSIAARYKTTVQELMSWNNMSGTNLAAGNQLTVYTRP